MPEKQIHPDRKAVYYAGMVITALGFIVFISLFVYAAHHFGDFNHFHSCAKSITFLSVGSMVLIIVGGILMGVGRMGLAGSGIKIDPEQVRKDVEPWARMSGGVLQGILDEAGIKFDSKTSEYSLPFDEKLRRLKKLRDDGVISQEEHEFVMKKIMDKI